MERVCFTLSVHPDKVEEYRSRHAAVWPEMQDALRAAGWQNYTLFLRDDGLAIGYVETDDFGQALARMDGLDVNDRWQSDMSALVASSSDRRVDQALQVLPAIFHLP